MAALRTSLSQSFRKVPPAAVPALLDCILSSTGESPASLFDSLLPDLSNLTKELYDANKKMSSEECAYLVSYIRGLCHLLKKFEVNSPALESFMWEAFIPSMKMILLYEKELLHEIVQSLLEVISDTNGWDLAEQTLIPFLLRSVALSLDANQSEDTVIIIWSGQFVYLGVRELQTLDKVLDNIPRLPLTLLCYILSRLLEAATEICQSVKGYPTSTDVFCPEKFGGHLVWNLCNLTIKMLSQSFEHRSCTATLLLPSLLKAFAYKASFEVCAQGERCNISRQKFFMKLWKSATVLFSQGSTERRDAYGIISLYLSYFSCVDGFQVEMGDEAKVFDIRAEKDFWDIIKCGLVEKEGFIRKQSLHIVKKVLFLNGELNSNVTEKKPRHRGSTPNGMTKRDLWAEEEAQSLGVQKICFSNDNFLNHKQKWEAFILLYEMLEEYGTHLVEAAWNHQIMLLLDSSGYHDSSVDCGASSQQVDVLSGKFPWLAILWERGLFHDNPLVRCLIMKSFLDIEWKSQGNCRDLFPEDFVLGALMQGLNDPVHHKDFGLKGIHCSITINAASKFFDQYCRFSCGREQISFLNKLASVAKEQSLSRPGLMCLSQCIVSAGKSTGVSSSPGDIEAIYGVTKHSNVPDGVNRFPCTDKAGLIDSLRYLVENSKQHFNPSFRFRVCEDIVEAAASVVHAHELPLESLLHFLGAMPREFTRSGTTRIKLQKWLVGNHNQCIAEDSSAKMHILQSLCDFPKSFTACSYSSGEVSFNDDDVVAWFAEAERWARVLFLLVEEENQLDPLFEFIVGMGIKICQQHSREDFMPLKFLILLCSLVHELELMQPRVGGHSESKPNTGSKFELCEMGDKNGLLSGKFADTFLIIVGNLISFAEASCSIFWADVALDSELPGSVTGKLGGPSQRRLSSPMTTSVLQAIVSLRTLAAISSWCALQRVAGSLSLAFTYLWKFFHKVVNSPIGDTETSAEIRLAAYEASAFVLKASVLVISSSAVTSIREMNKSSKSIAKHELILDPLVLTFLNQVNCLLAVQHLTRSRKAVLMNWKWLCLEAILSIPHHALQNGVQLGHGDVFLSDDAVRYIFGDLLESLENAGEGSVLPMLKSVRMVLDLLTSSSSNISSCHGVDVEMIWQLVRSSWILHTSCNKRRVAPIAALLSSVLHVSVFGDEDMHVAHNAPGPLKWFCERILEEGTKSPRTIRLAALHLTGLWLANPGVIKYYMKELKLLTLYGSVAFDEDFEAELLENGEARSEVSLLAKSPDTETTEAFINTELYARVSVAVLFYKLAELAKTVGSGKQTADICATFESGKLFLLELLDSAVNDNDLSKELYKKYSAIHRRKVRAWQMICVLSKFVHQDIIQRVVECLSICLYRNNLPAVRQYLETFAIHVYLNFPFLVKEHLVPILGDYNMKTQALSSYVFIAANIMLHAKDEVQTRHLDDLLPSLIPLLTSHHHTLRGFTQLLVYQVFCKLLPDLNLSSVSINLEKRCFCNLKTYLAQNPDCVRLRASMEGFLDAFNTDESVTPAGIFSNRIEDMQFECVPMSLMEQVTTFLNDVREELRSSMAKDEVTLKNESLMNTDNPERLLPDARQEKLLSCPSTDLSLDFQKKFTLSKHDMRDEMEKEDQLLEQILRSRLSSVEKMKANRQQIVLVASLLDRIPNLAGLARTCEVFKASGLVLADASVLHDKQFQLISVTAEKWVPIIEVPVKSVKNFLEKKKREGFSILGLEQTANSILLDKYSYPQKTVLVLGREKEGIPADIIHILDACIEIPQLGVVRSLNVHVSGAIAIWEYTRQQRSRQHSLCL